MKTTRKTAKRKPKVTPIPAKKINSRQKDFQALATIMTEFLSSFVVVGHDFEGNSVQISNYHNTQEYNSLSVLVQNYLVELHNTNNNQDG